MIINVLNADNQQSLCYFGKINVSNAKDHEKYNRMKSNKTYEFETMK